VAATVRTAGAAVVLVVGASLTGGAVAAGAVTVVEEGDPSVAADGSVVVGMTWGAWMSAGAL
jgi:hypothetical protein